MIKKLLLICSLVCMAASCSGPVEDASLSDRFRKEMPYTLAVLQVQWASEISDKKAGEDFRLMTSEKLLAMGYRLVPPDAVDAAYVNGNAGTLDKKRMAKMADKLGADGLVLIRVSDWDAYRIGKYAALNIEAGFSIYSKKGELIWSATHKTSEDGFSLDPEPLDIAVVKVYEPRILRFVEAIFATLPQAERPASEKTFFEWLP